jgi:acyl carrier protein
LVKGEILIGGSCLAKGYWKRPELTEEKFIANPFGPGRLYRTGDWGRYTLGGEIEYLERQDTQTKIRGVRIELSEIEANIRQLAAIENVVVKKGQTANNLECLIAYYVLKAGHNLEQANLRNELRKHLPETIIPDYFIRLDAFPTSENGKLDRKALPNVVNLETAPINPLTRQLDEQETKISAIWQRVLGVPSLDTAQNFFDAGGNSMSLLLLRAQLEKELGTTIKVAELFQHPTIAGMAALFKKTVATAETPATADRAQKQRQTLQNFGPRPKRTT